MHDSKEKDGPFYQGDYGYNSASVVLICVTKWFKNKARTFSLGSVYKKQRNENDKHRISKRNLIKISMKFYV